ncbi:MAG TPA: MFS transporter [Steroidobacteraceae bacterium]|nr:MFS transporter [Steroidobacteraceae bacterium]
MSTSAAQPNARHAWFAVAMVFLFMLINFADKAVIGLSGPAIMKELGLTPTRFGLLGSAFFWLFALSGVIGGFIANRVSTRRLMLTLSAIWSVSLLPMSGRVGFPVLLGSRVVLGAAEGPAFPLSMHAIYQWFADRYRALPSGIVASGAAFGSGLIAPLITWLIVSYSWHAAFAALSAAGLLWTLVWLGWGSDGPLGASGPGASGAEAGGRIAQQARVPYRRLLLTPTALGVFIAGFAAYWLIALNLVWLASFLIKSMQLAPSAAAWVIALPSAMQIVLGIGLGWLSQRLTRAGYSSRLARGMLGCLCVITAGALTAGLPLVPQNALRIAIIGVAFSIGNVIFVLGSTLIAEICPGSQRGALLGITNSIHTLAGLIAPLAMGMLVDAGTDPLRGFRIGFVSAGILVAALGVVAAWLIDPEADILRLHPLHASVTSSARFHRRHEQA